MENKTNIWDVLKKSFQTPKNEPQKNTIPSIRFSDTINKSYKVIDSQTIQDRYISVTDNGQTILLANFKEKQQFISNYSLISMIRENKIQEINLKEVSWIHPHLYKPIKQKIYAEQ